MGNMEAEFLIVGGMMFTLQFNTQMLNDRLEDSHNIQEMLCTSCNNVNNMQISATRCEYGYLPVLALHKSWMAHKEDSLVEQG